MPLTGIANENEFYSAHYLDAILKEDLKGVAQQWKEKAVEKHRCANRVGCRSADEISFLFARLIRRR